MKRILLLIICLGAICCKSQQWVITHPFEEVYRLLAEIVTDMVILLWEPAIIPVIRDIWTHMRCLSEMMVNTLKESSILMDINHIYVALYVWITAMRLWLVSKEGR